MGNVVGGEVYTSSSEFTQMRVALKKKELPFIGSLALFVWVTRLSLTKPPEESQPTNASSFVSGCLTARSILSFSIQCLRICMIASVETAKWKLCRKSTRLRPNPLSSLLDNISRVYPPFFPVPMNTMCLYRCLNIFMIGHGGPQASAPQFHSTYRNTKSF